GGPGGPAGVGARPRAAAAPRRPARPPGRRAHRWDIQLQQGRTGLKIGRRLTDLRRRDQVIRTSFRIIALEDGSLLRVHAYITSAGALAVSCVGFEGAPDGAEERE
ncbi:hypothetical protein ACFV5C_38000, partial [Streptomyces sp. NPDC059762]